MDQLAVDIYALMWIKKARVREAIISSKVVFRELTGNLESYFCIHQQSNIYLRPISRDLLLSSNFGIDVKIGTDGSSDIDSAISVSATGDAFFFKESAKITGHRLQISVESNKNTEGYVLRGYDTRYRVQDRRDINFTSSENLWQKELSNVTSFWYTRPYHNVNRLDATPLVVDAGSYSLVDSPDSRVNAMRLTTDFSGVTSTPTALNGTVSMSLWLRNLQTPSAKILSYGASSSIMFMTSSTELNVFGQIFTIGDIDKSKMTNIFFVANGTNVTLYVDGVLNATKTQLSVPTTSELLRLEGCVQDVFDLKAYKAPPSIEAIRYYIDDILTNQGGITLPMG